MSVPIPTVSQGLRRRCLPAGIGTCFTLAVSTPATSDGPAPGTALARSQAARRRRVLDAALRLAERGGFDAVQMRDVATEANVATWNLSCSAVGGSGGLPSMFNVAIN